MEATYLPQPPSPIYPLRFNSFCHSQQPIKLIITVIALWTLHISINTILPQGSPQMRSFEPSSYVYAMNHRHWTALQTLQCFYVSLLLGQPIVAPHVIDFSPLLVCHICYFQLHKRQLNLGPSRSLWTGIGEKSCRHFVACILTV